MKYYITGPDGSGKTTLLKEIEKYFLSQNYSVLHIWLRFPMIISRPLMLLCRIIGLTKYSYIDGFKVGTHDFYKSKFISWLYPYLQYLDFQIKFFKYKKLIESVDIVLLDRFVIDIVADIMIDTHRFDFHKTRLGKSFLKHLHQKYNIIFLDVSEKNLRNRKKDVYYDSRLSLKIQVYKILSKDLGIDVIDNNASFEEVTENIFKRLKINDRY